MNDKDWLWVRMFMVFPSWVMYLVIHMIIFDEDCGYTLEMWVNEEKSWTYFWSGMIYSLILLGLTILVLEGQR